MAIYVFVFVLLLIAVVKLFFNLRTQWRVASWRRALGIGQHEKVFNDLYQSIDGFSLSREARVNHDALEYVYGEIEFEPFIALLALCKPHVNTVFYDLGSGAGKAVLACAMVFNVKKCCGIELFSSLHQCAQQQKNRLFLLPDYQPRTKHIVFKQGDFLDSLFPDATLIFINATAFFSDHWENISKHLEQVSPGTQVISTSKPLISSLFITEKTSRVLMSWGVVTAYIQLRLPDKT
jgi:hypothetical protein